MERLVVVVVVVVIVDVVVVVLVVVLVVVVVVVEADQRSRLSMSTCRYELNWQEPSSTHSCECSRARKLALNSQTTWRSAKN